MRGDPSLCAANFRQLWRERLRGFVRSRLHYAAPFAAFARMPGIFDILRAREETSYEKTNR